MKKQLAFLFLILSLAGLLNFCGSDDNKITKGSDYIPTSNGTYEVIQNYSLRPENRTHKRQYIRYSINNFIFTCEIVDTNLLPRFTSDFYTMLESHNHGFRVSSYVDSGLAFDSIYMPYGQFEKFVKSTPLVGDSLIVSHLDTTNDIFKAFRISSVINNDSTIIIDSIPGLRGNYLGTYQAIRNYQSGNEETFTQKVNWIFTDFRLACEAIDTISYPRFICDFTGNYVLGDKITFKDTTVESCGFDLSLIPYGEFVLVRKAGNANADTLILTQWDLAKKSCKELRLVRLSGL